MGGSSGKSLERKSAAPSDLASWSIWMSAILLISLSSASICNCSPLDRNGNENGIGWPQNNGNEMRTETGGISGGGGERIFLPLFHQQGQNQNPPQPQPNHPYDFPSASSRLGLGSISISGSSSLQFPPNRNDNSELRFFNSYYNANANNNEGNTYGDNDFERGRRNSGPSLSIVNPLDVLRQRLLLEIGRRRLHNQSQQINANTEFLKTIGKRRRR